MEKIVTVVMAFDKETVGTMRFKEVTKPGESPQVGTIYVPKRTLLKLGNPEQIILTIKNG